VLKGEKSIEPQKHLNQKLGFIIKA